jgi:hypothetical protein
MKLIIIFIIFSTSALEAQVVRQPLSVQYTALGAYSKRFTDVFSGTENQASLAALKTGAFGVYGERRFMLAELNGVSAIVAVPTSSGTIGIQTDYFGSSSYNESQAGFIYARKISEQVNVGAKFNYHLVRVAGYGTASVVNFEAGAILHLTDRLHTGVHIYNPAGGNLGKTGSRLASVYRFGLGYEVSEKLFWGVAIVKQQSRTVGVKTGLQYNLATSVFIRSGLSTLDNNSFISVGFDVGFGRIDVNSGYHAQLGFTPGILLLVNFKKQAEE